MNKDLGAMNPTVTALFDEATNTVTYIVADPATAKAAIVDCVLDFNPKSARTSTGSADRLIEAVPTSIPMPLTAPGSAFSAGSGS